ncbi:MAG: hypothetical protein RLZZ262_1177 [Bacteroidota bacterium]|jgi:anthranilate synthase component II
MRNLQPIQNSMKSPQIAIIDNFDSFTYNLVHALEAVGASCVVMRNNSLDWKTLEMADGVVLGPGPGLPFEAGELMIAIDRLHKLKPMLGVCLGHQAIGEYFGAELINLESVYHGCEANVSWIGENSLVENCPGQWTVGLYHSWAVRLAPDSNLEALAFSSDDVLMAFRHRALPLYGIQFHPESVMTAMGRDLLGNWVQTL